MSNKKLYQRICTVGVWHQGSVLSACLADLGHEVKCVVEAALVADFTAGRTPVFEPKLRTIVRRNVKAGRLSYTPHYSVALKNADFAFVSFDTPVNDEDEADTRCVEDAVREIAKNAAKRLVLVVTAQVPVGTCDHLVSMARALAPNCLFDIAYVPEFLRLGIAVRTFREADRVVVGCGDPAVAKCVANLYAPLGRPIVYTDVRSAEMSKHASNTFLATSISFINEIADLCDEVGADAVEVAKIMKLDRRIGKYAFLSPGLGFAGGTLGRDIRTLQKLGAQFGKKTLLQDAVIEVNRARPCQAVDRLRRVYPSLQDRRIAVFGLTYKPGTSTLRRSVGLQIIAQLNSLGASVRAFDPMARLEESADLPKFEFFSDPYETVKDCDAAILVTEWPDLRKLQLPQLVAAMRSPVLIDTRNFFDPAQASAAGMTYFGIGRGTACRREKE